MCTSTIEPARLNDQLNDPIDQSEPSPRALVETIHENGILDSIVVSADGYILSGHRRHGAAVYLELERITVCIRADVSDRDDLHEFLWLLAS